MLTYCKRILLVTLITGGQLASMAQSSQGQPPVPQRNFNIEAFGARGDGSTDNTTIIQQQIDRCSANGGGKVIIPAGKFLTGTLYLKNDVTLYLEDGAWLLGSPQLKDYPVNTASTTPGSDRRSLLFAEGARHIAVTGNGTIDGQGGSPDFKRGDNGNGRPRLIYFIDCEDVKVQDITLRQAAFWVQYYRGCNNVTIRGIKVYSHANWNNDGLDIDSRNVIVSDCIIDSDDDALCFKSESNFPCENITVTNCILSSNCNAIKMGTASKVGFKHIAISNCIVKTASEDNIRHWKTTLSNITADRTVLSGIALEMVDGGIMDGINISNIDMTDVQTPVFIRLGSRSRNKDASGQHVPSSLKNIQISHINAIAQSQISCSITGIPGARVENITLDDIRISMPGGGVVIKQVVEEKENAYPENRMFGNSLPASGMYIRHAKNIGLHNIQWYTRTPDQRPVFWLEDTEGAVINNPYVNGRQPGQSLTKLVQAKNVTLSGDRSK